jgi:hypothetical protein
LVRAGGELQAHCVVAAEGLKPQNISHQEKDGYLFSPTLTSAVAAQWQRSGSAVAAQWHVLSVLAASDPLLDF